MQDSCSFNLKYCIYIFFRKINKLIINVFILFIFNRY